jgi:hypothetical protein
MIAKDGSEIRLRQLSTDTCVWQILRYSVKDRLAAPTREGWIITYVDDLLSISAEHYGLEVLQAVAEIWKCSDIETLSLQTELTFLGLKIRLTKKGIFLHQTITLLNS